MKNTRTLQADTGYIPALDGFRGLAILTVVVSHYGFGDLIPGGFGVTLFFFISGFLITRLMIQEQQQDGRIDLKNFYIRRLLRLYPALLAMIAVSSLYIAYIGCRINVGEIVSTLFYYRNYYIVYFRGDVSEQCSKIFDIVWSLAIEEHFYIVFPLLFIAFCKRQSQFMLLLAVGIVGVLAWRLYIVSTEGMSAATVYKIYHLTETRADAIMYGCLISLLLNSTVSTTFIRTAGHKLMFTAAISLLLFTFIYRNPAFRETYRYSLQGIAMAFFVPAILYHPTYKAVKEFLSRPWLTLVGRLSYSVYMFHWVGVCIAIYVISPDRRSLPWIATALPIGLVLSLLSYNFVEKPMNRLRKRFGSNVQTAEAVNIGQNPTPVAIS